MKLIVAGTRSIPEPLAMELIGYGLRNWRLRPTLIISGECQGVDLAAKRFARMMEIRYRGLRARWDEQGRSAGPIRNAEMLALGDELLLIWDGRSAGSKNIFEQALRSNKVVYEVNLELRRHG